MNEFDINKQKLLNLYHAENPQVGDYWMDHLMPVCVVLEAGKWSVSICRKTKDVDNDHWTWDLDNVEVMTRKEFDNWLQYGDSVSGYWAWVVPEKFKLHLIEYARET